MKSDVAMFLEPTAWFSFLYNFYERYKLYGRIIRYDIKKYMIKFMMKYIIYPCIKQAVYPFNLVAFSRDHQMSSIHVWILVENIMFLIFSSNSPSMFGGPCWRKVPEDLRLRLSAEVILQLSLQLISLSKIYANKLFYFY